MLQWKITKTNSFLTLFLVANPIILRYNSASSVFTLREIQIFTLTSQNCVRALEISCYLSGDLFPGSHIKNLFCPAIQRRHP